LPRCDNAFGRNDTYGTKELARMGAMEKVKEGTMSLAEAAAVLRVSYRQAKRIGKAVKTEL
jgi:hypothetical protein